MADEERFTAWLNAPERKALRDAAEMMGSSQNYIARLVFRAAFGLPLSDYQRSQLSQLSQVTNEAEVPS